MGRQGDRQGDLMVMWSEMPRSPGHVFYDRLQQVLGGAGFDGVVTLVNADGSGRQALTPDAYSPGLAWSPDGEWVLGRRGAPGDARLVLVRVRDRLTLPLRFSLDLYQPSWR